MFRYSIIGFSNQNPQNRAQKGIGTSGGRPNTMQTGTEAPQTTGVPSSAVCLHSTHFCSHHLQGTLPTGSAWKWDETTQEYFLHLFCPEQPDLNWENPHVRAIVHDVMKFWLDKGVDGFRMDVINLISKVPGLPDAPVSLPGEEWQPGTMFYANGPRMHEFLHEMRKEVLNKYDIITVGEMPWTNDPKEVLDAIGQDREELDMIFQFDM